LFIAFTRKASLDIDAITGGSFEKIIARKLYKRRLDALRKVFQALVQEGSHRHQDCSCLRVMAPLLAAF